MIPLASIQKAANVDALSWITRRSIGFVTRWTWRGAELALKNKPSSWVASQSWCTIYKQTIFIRWRTTTRPSSVSKWPHKTTNLQPRLKNKQLQHRQRWRPTAQASNLSIQSGSWRPMWLFTSELSWYGSSTRWYTQSDSKMCRRTNSLQSCKSLHSFWLAF